MSLLLPPLSLYIHIPWCVRKCPYCDFNSHQRPAQLPQIAYVDALLADLDLDLPQVQGRAIESVFFGGGTPSLFSGAEVQRLLDGVRARLALSADCEITLETNPGTAEFDRFEAYLAAGVNRISFGAQSFDAIALQRLGRIHGPEEIHRAFAAARAAGVANINLDLMVGLPGQSLAGALNDLQQAIALGPEHLSHYQLTLEEGTVYARFPPQDLPDAELCDAMASACAELLAAAGYGHYEVSAYAKPGQRSRHNLNYWQFGDYLGIGAGAHAKWTDPATGTLHRRAKQRTPTRYLQTAGREECWQSDAPIPPEQRPFEFMLNALRLIEGFTPTMYAQRTGLELDHAAGFHSGLQRGLLESVDGRVRATDLGQRFLNDAVGGFLP